MITLLRIIVLQLLWHLFLHKSFVQYQVFMPFIALSYNIVDYKFFSHTRKWKPFLLFNVVIFILGFVSDLALIQFDLINFSFAYKSLPPFYIIAVWINFIPYYDMGLGSYHKKIALLSALGFIFAPIAYYRGASLGLITISNLSGYFSIAVIWAFFLPLSTLIFHKMLKKNL